MEAVIGVVAGLMGIVEFSINHFAAPKHGMTTVRIGAGLDVVHGLENGGGDVPGIRLFNEGAELLNKKEYRHPPYIGDGDFYDIEIETNGQQSTYTLFSAKSDALCIAYATITMPDGSKYGFDGDLGRFCGGAWYYSNYYIDGSKTEPSCTWIDSDGDIPGNATGFSVHWPDFAPSHAPQIYDQPVNITQDICHNNYSMVYYYDKDPKTIRHKIPDGIHPPNSKDDVLPPERKGHRLREKWRERMERLGRMGRKGKGIRLPVRAAITATSYNALEHLTSTDDQQDQDHRNSSDDRSRSTALSRLVIDDVLERRPHALCDSPTSYGPDYVSVAHGTFCRMSDKTLWPVCDEKISHDCFDLGSHRLVAVVNDKATRAPAYNNVIDWRK